MRESTIKPTTIFVKGRPHVIDKDKITYDEVVTLAYPQGKRGPLFEYNVAWKDGSHKESEGILQENKTVPIVEGMKFDVSFTDKS